MNDVRKGEEGTDPSLSSAVFVRENGDFVDKGDIADDATVDMPPNKDYLLLGGHNAGSGGTYYVTKEEGSTGCIGRDGITIDPKLPQIATSLTTAVVDNPDSNTNTAFAVGADESLLSLYDMW